VMHREIVRTRFTHVQTIPVGPPLLYLRWPILLISFLMDAAPAEVA
jgi:hypothetical protein